MKKINWGVVATLSSLLVTGLTIVSNIASQKQQDEEITKKAAEAVAEFMKKN